MKQKVNYKMDIGVRLVLYYFGLVAFVVILLAAGSVGGGAYVWATNIIPALNSSDASSSSQDYDEFHATIVPTYASVLCFSTTLFLLGVAAFIGAVKKIRAPVFALASLGLMYSFLQMIGLAVLIYRLYEAGRLLSTTLGVISIAIMGASALEFCMILPITFLIHFNSVGREVYITVLLSGKSGYTVTKYIFDANWAICALGCGSFAFVSVVYFRDIAPNINSDPFKSVPGLNWTPVGIMVGSGLTIACIVCGLCGNANHSFAPLLCYVVTEFVAQLFVVGCALVILVETGKSLTDAISTPSWANLSLVSIMAATVLILTGLQFALTFFIAIVMQTDKISVYKADYL